MSWLGELYSVCQYLNCRSEAVASVMIPGYPRWRLCEHHARHGALSPEEQAALVWHADP